MTTETKQGLGQNKSNLGRKLPDGVKKKMSLAKTGANNPAWKGGTRKASIKKWRDEHRDILNFYTKRRRAKRFENGGSHTFGEWETLKAQYDWTCPGCEKKEPTIKLTQDHIVPLSQGGSDNIENIQPLCFSCNSKKCAKVIRY
jgi:hypothetical protein